jgi:hypothetical protein
MVLSAAANFSRSAKELAKSNEVTSGSLTIPLEVTNDPSSDLHNAT